MVSEDVARVQSLMGAVFGRKLYKGGQDTHVLPFHIIWKPFCQSWLYFDFKVVNLHTTLVKSDMVCVCLGHTNTFLMYVLFLMAIVSCIDLCEGVVALTRKT